MSRSVMVKTATVVGVAGRLVDLVVEYDPDGCGFDFRGASESSAREASVRVRSALAASGWALSGRITAVLSEPVRDCAALDLAVAVGAIHASGGGFSRDLDAVILGELSLDGGVRRVAGGLPVALEVRDRGYGALVLPRECASEGAAVGDAVSVYAASTLADAVAHLRGKRDLPLARFCESPPAHEVDLAEVRGLEIGRRAIEIAAAGGHNLLLLGPPGTGKSMLARRLPSILPPPGREEAIETTSVYSAAGKLGGASLLGARPFRAPHHDVSVAGLVGGGPNPRPGEINLAHNGVLFLDDLPEFSRATLEALRQPLEDREVVVVRARRSIRFPASFLLVAAMNPCPCGYRGSPQRACICTGERVRRYLGRLSGLLDRFDIHLEVPHVDYRALRADGDAESSERVRARVVAARELQRRRLGACFSNAQLGPRSVREHCRLDERADRFLECCATRFALSPRAVHGVLRVARTIADLAVSDAITDEHVAEAAALRVLDRQEQA